MSDTTALTIVTPETIKSSSVKEQIDIFNSTQTALQEARKEVNRANKSIEDFLANATLDCSQESLLGRKIQDIEKHIVVYKEIPELTEEQKILEECQLNDSNEIEDFLVDANKTQEVITKKFGNSVIDFLKQIKEFRKPEKEIDKEATETKRKEFNAIGNVFFEARNELQALEFKMKDIKEFVDFYKDIASIAAIKNENKD